MQVGESVASRGVPAPGVIQIMFGPPCSPYALSIVSGHVEWKAALS